MLNVTIPGLPPMNTADGLNRWRRHTLKKLWEGKVAGAVLMELGRWPSKPLDRAAVTITRCSSSEPDFDGLVQGGKFLLDGLVKAGVIADDKPSVIGQPVFRWEKAPPKQGCVRIVVEAVEVEIGERVSA